MKIRTKKSIIAATVAAACVGTVVGAAFVSNANIRESFKNSFNGSYTLHAFADGTEGTTPETLNTKYMLSDDCAYMLLVTAFDLNAYAEFIAEKEVTAASIGYIYNGTDYSSNYKYYSSINVGATNYTAADIYGATSVADMDAKLIVAEVEYAENASYNAYLSVTASGETKDFAFTTKTSHTHSFGAFSLTTIPTLTKNGVASRTCETGNETQTISLPKVSTDSDYYTKGEDGIWTYNSDSSIAFISEQTDFETFNSSFFAYSGSTSTTKGSVTYEDITYSTCLKMESSTSITFSLPDKADVKLVFGGDTAASGKSVKIDGTSYTADENGIVSVNLDSGAHEIKKGDAINLYYIDITAVVNKHEHSYGDWTITKEPTETLTGTAERTCSVGGEIQSVDIPVLTDDTVWTVTETIDSTCTTKGSKTYSSEYGTVTVELPLGEHIDGDGDSICDICGKSITTTGPSVVIDSTVFATMTTGTAQELTLSEELKYYINGSDSYDEAQSVTVDDVTYTGALKLGGNPSSGNKRYFILNISKPCKIEVVYSGQSTSATYIGLTTTITTSVNDGTSTGKTVGSKVTFEITQSEIDSNTSGIWYIISNSKVFYYYIAITY